MQITYLAIQGGIFSHRNVNMTSLHIYFPTYFNLSQHLLITKISNVIYHSTYVMKLISNGVLLIIQGKSEGFDSCDQPSNFTQIGFKLLIFQPVRPSNLPDDVKNNGYLFYATSFVHHSKALFEFKLKLQSRNAKLARFLYCMTLKFDGLPWHVIGHLPMLLKALYIIMQPAFYWNWSYSPETLNSGENLQFLSCLTLIFDRWPWKTVGPLFYPTSSFVHHFIAICEFKLVLQSRNAQVGSKLAMFCPVWPWDLMDDLTKLQGTSPMPHQALYIISSPYVNSNRSYCPETA